MHYRNPYFKPIYPVLHLQGILVFCTNSSKIWPKYCVYFVQLTLLTTDKRQAMKFAANHSARLTVTLT